MSKWQCCVCGESEPCILHMVNDKEGFRPVCCPVDNTSGIKPDWLPVDKPVTDCSQLPKLTAEVFDRPDCPEWAKYAAVDRDGMLFYFSNKPLSHTANGHWMMDIFVKCVFVAEEKFDSTDWKNSLIERPAKLPDWVEIGGYVYDARNGYGKIISGSVKSCYIEFDGGAGDFVPEAFAELKQARLRPFNADEMKALVTKVIENEDELMFVTGYDKKDNLVVVWDEYFSADSLLKKCTIDGKPCGVLEHLENGEWVK